jgi:hypothetical protein
MTVVMMVWCGKAFGNAATIESLARVCGRNLMKLRINGVTIYRRN